jgi:hypothetical protein
MILESTFREEIGRPRVERSLEIQRIADHMPVISCPPDATLTLPLTPTPTPTPSAFACRNLRRGAGLDLIPAIAGIGITGWRPLDRLQRVRQHDDCIDGKVVTFTGRSKHSLQIKDLLAQRVGLGGSIDQARSLAPLVSERSR